MEQNSYLHIINIKIVHVFCKKEQMGASSISWQK